jgi:succinyl-CoA synthetase beta subunit
VAHKSDVGGVRVDVRQEDVARSAQALLEEVERRSGIVPEHLLVQERVTGGIEILVGFQRDPCLGPTIVIGAGGVLTELMSDAAAALLPIERADALDMLAELKVSRLLHGVRGRPASDIDALLAAVARFAAMVQALGERLVEAEINPLFVLPAPRGVRAADGLVVLR